jgi:L-ascorbate 6-phosphate lactonase
MAGRGSRIHQILSEAGKVVKKAVMKGKELIARIDELSVGPGSLAFWWIGQLGYVLKFGKTIVYIDAFLSEEVDRLIPPLFRPEEITNADFVMGSHDHGDHIDRKAWHQLSTSSPRARFVVPGLLVESLVQDLGIVRERFIAADDGATVEEGGIRVTGIAAAHEFLDRDPDTGRFPYLGFIIEGNGMRVYHSGDCCVYDGLYSRLARRGRIDVAFLPINGRDAKRYRANIIGNMTYQEAVDLAGTLQVGLSVPGHYEMFSGNSEDPALFREYLEAKFPGVGCWIGAHGDAVQYARAGTRPTPAPRQG